jgi:hypothetical protein
MIAFSRHRITDSTCTFQQSPLTVPPPFPCPCLGTSPFQNHSPDQDLAEGHLLRAGRGLENPYSIYLSLLIASVLAPLFAFWTASFHPR